MYSALALDGMFVFVIAFFVIVFCIIASSIVKMTADLKKRQNNADGKTQQNNQKDLQTSSADSEHDEIINRRIENAKKASGGERQNAYSARKDVKTIDDTSGNVVKSKDICEQAKEPVPHKHPSASGKVRAEKKPKSDAHGDEGCAHNDVRYVLDDVIPKDETDENVKELQRAVVWSEILSNPKYKK